LALPSWWPFLCEFFSNKKKQTFFAKKSRAEKKLYLLFIIVAVSHDEYGIPETRSKRRIKESDRMDYLLHEAAAAGFIEKAEQLVNTGTELDGRNRKGNTPLHEAARNGKIEMIEWLVEKGADLQSVDNNGGTPLHHITQQ
jgi:ankyrin repeat protein